MLTSLAIFIVGLLPVLGLIPFTYQFVSTVADRYVYLAMLGPALALAWLLRSHHKTVSLSLTYAALFLFAGLSFFQTAAWSNSRTLYQHCLVHNPRAFIASNNLGHLAFNNQKYDEALHHLKTRLR